MDFRYIIKDDDKTIEEVNNTAKFYNYDEIHLHDFDKSYEDLYYEILYNNEIAKNSIYKRSNFNKKYIKDSTYLWELLDINLHNINIFKKYADMDKFSEVNEKLFKAYKSDDPKRLPLVFDRKRFNDAGVNYLEVDETEKLPNALIFKNIEMPIIDKNCASTIYAHELSHTQLLTQDGGTNSFFNEETIPMLMEFIFANNLDNSNVIYNQVLCQRLMSLCRHIARLDHDNITYMDRINAEKYTISSLQAINLANIYNLGNIRLRKEMQKDISLVFNKEILTEELLDKYESHYENVDKDIKRLKR